VEVRPLRREELRAAHEARIATWKTAYRGMVADSYLDAYALTDEAMAAIESRYDEGLARSFCAVDAGEVVGLSVAGPCRDEDRPGGEELYALYVLPDFWGSGAGQQLFDAALPFTSLWVLEANARARAFYERNGFRADATKEIVFGEPVVEVRYVR
jgi:GNAT superfamily N-acetyltransferase